MRVVLLVVLMLPLVGRAAPPNFLFICTDDLRPMLGCYGAEWMHTPHIDTLAERGVVFERAYCQAAQCGPSRVSFMTGLRPETTRVFSLRDRFEYAKREPRESLTIGRHLKANGYSTQSLGKIYHDGRDDDLCWSEGASPGREGEMWEVVPEGGGATVIADREACPAWQNPDVEDEALYAGRMTTQAVSAIKDLGAAKKPFFLGVGYRRPHLPFVAPRQYYDLYPDKDAKWLLPKSSQPPMDGPVLGFYNSTNYAPPPGKGSRWQVPPLLRPQSRAEALSCAGYELRSYLGVPQRGPFGDDLTRDLRRAYAACVSYVDAQIGRLMTGLEEAGVDENTVVILLSDHGWHLGEHGTWSKMTNYEWATRVPLIVSAPGKDFVDGRSEQPVELVDLYPTVCDLAEVPKPTQLEGESLLPLLRNPDSENEGAAAFSQFPRKLGPTGRTIRTRHWRYVEWRDEKNAEVVARELYDHRSDPGELNNLAGDGKFAGTMSELADRLAKRMR